MKPNRTSLSLLLLIGVVATSWYVFADRIAPGVLEKAYFGQSYSFINARIRGQEVHSVDHYLKIWATVSRLGLIAIITSGMAVLVLIRPETERLLSMWIPVPKTKSEPGISGRFRLMIVNGLIGAIVLGHVICIVAQKEYWPWCNYEMYSGVMPPATGMVRVFGLIPEGEIAVPESQCLQPFDNMRLSVALTRLHEKNADMSQSLHSLLTLYRKNREAGLHHGPPLMGLQVYRIEWDHEPAVQNLDRPRTRELVCEILETTGEPTR